MEESELNRVDASRLDSGYAGEDELLRDCMAWLDLLLYDYYAHHQWLGPSGEMKNLLGLVVTREEFEHNLTKAAQRGLSAELSEEEREQLVPSPAPPSGCVWKRRRRRFRCTSCSSGSRLTSLNAAASCLRTRPRSTSSTPGFSPICRTT